MSHEVLDPARSDEIAGNGGWMVVIFDNPFNTMDEVMWVLMEATHCDEQEAFIEMWEAHTFGKAPVHFASSPECHTVAQVIDAIGVTAKVLREWQD
jgi:ATP-dependent Clp protease adapter protein ClpS